MEEKPDGSEKASKKETVAGLVFKDEQSISDMCFILVCVVISELVYCKGGHLAFSAVFNKK